MRLLVLLLLVASLVAADMMAKLPEATAPDVYEQYKAGHPRTFGLPVRYSAEIEGRMPPTLIYETVLIIAGFDGDANDRLFADELIDERAAIARAWVEL